MFFGTGAFAVPSLERLAGDPHHRVCLCVTRPDRPRGRGLAIEASPVKQAAQGLGLPLAQPERPERALVADAAPDVGVVVAYGQLIRPELLAVPRQGMLGMHPSLLPKYRGAAPVPHAVLQGEASTGVTVFQMDERLDAGPVLLQREASLAPGEGADTLLARLAGLGADALLEAFALIERGAARPRPQDESEATYAPKLTKAQGEIDWRRPAEEIERLIRATQPWPGAFTWRRGARLKIHAAVVAREPERGAPGTVQAVGSEGVLIATGNGALELRALQPAGRRPMRMREYLAGHPMRVGERLGA